MRLSALRAECAPDAEALRPVTLARLFWTEAKLTQFGQRIADKLLPKKHLFLSTREAARIDGHRLQAEAEEEDDDAADMVRTETSWTFFVRTRAKLNELFDSLESGRYIDPELLQLVAATELMPADPVENTVSVVEIRFELRTGECRWCAMRSDGMKVQRPVFVVTGRADLDQKVWVHFVRRPRVGSIVPAGRLWRMFRDVPGVRVVEWTNTVTREEWAIIRVAREPTDGAGVGAGGANPEGRQPASKRSHVAVDDE